MSIDTIRDKLAKAVAERQGLAKAPEQITFGPVSTGDPITKKRSQGRPRKRYRMADVSLDSTKSVRLWASERLIPAPDNITLVGTPHDRGHIKTLPGGSGVTRYQPRYETRTMIEDFTQWCVGKGWPRPTIGKSFGALVILSMVERGHSVKAIKTSWRRRAAIEGVQILGEPSWDGHENVKWNSK